MGPLDGRLPDRAGARQGRGSLRRRGAPLRRCSPSTPRRWGRGWCASWPARSPASALVAQLVAGAKLHPPPAAFDDNLFLTHDPRRYARNVQQVAQHPELALGSPTWGWVAFAFAATDELQHGQGPLFTAKTPMTVAGRRWAPTRSSTTPCCAWSPVASRAATTARSPAPTTRFSRRPTPSGRSSGRRSTERRRGFRTLVEVSLGHSKSESIPEARASELSGISLAQLFEVDPGRVRFAALRGRHTKIGDRGYPSPAPFQLTSPPLAAGSRQRLVQQRAVAGDRRLAAVASDRRAVPVGDQAAGAGEHRHGGLDVPAFQPRPRPRGRGRRPPPWRRRRRRSLGGRGGEAARSQRQAPISAASKQLFRVGGGDDRIGERQAGAHLAAVSPQPR